jgi:hypothetical protein
VDRYLEKHLLARLRRWEDNIKIDPSDLDFKDVNCIELAQDHA